MQKVGNTTDTADSNGEYTNGNVAQGIPPTIINAEMLNTFQRELINVVEGSGQVLNPMDNRQLFKAINKLVSNFPVIASSNGHLKIPIEVLPDGLIIQWGMLYGTTGQLAGLYSTAFPNSVFQAVVSLADKDSGVTGGISVYVNADTLKNRTILTVNPIGSDGVGNTSARFIAVGF